MKSIEKLAEAKERANIHAARIVLRRSSYELLGMMLACATGEISLTTQGVGPEMIGQGLDKARLEGLLNQHFDRLPQEVEEVLRRLKLNQAHRAHLDREFDQWTRKRGWPLINGTVAQDFAAD